MLSTQAEEDLRKVPVTVRSKASQSASSRNVQIGAEAAKDLLWQQNISEYNQIFLVENKEWFIFSTKW